MSPIVDESTIQRGLDALCAAATFGENIKDAANRVGEGVSQVKKTVTETFEDSKAAAERALKQGRYAVQDSVDEAVYQIKRQPVRAVALAFAAGLVFGFVVPRVCRSGRA